MSIVHATRQYESWLAGQVSIVREDLAVKHKSMAADSFSFLRATFYRWAQLFPLLCPELARATKVLSVGDLHVENFGTWRDAEGRLIWGINDFDEACPLPYTNDLVRLAASVWLAIELEELTLGPGNACKAILEGYAKGLDQGGCPFVLSEHHRWLGEAVTGRLRDPTDYWEKLSAQHVIPAVPSAVRVMLESASLAKGLELRVVHRQAGLGSLGRPRFTAIAEWRGGKIARELKALVPSSWLWAAGLDQEARIYYDEIVRGAVRAADPFLQVRDRWVLRRLAPYCSRIELSQLPRRRDEERLLRAMGFELANVHVGTRGGATRIRSDLRRRKSEWLQHAAKSMAEAVFEDWRVWKGQTS